MKKVVALLLVAGLFFSQGTEMCFAGEEKLVSQKMETEKSDSTETQGVETETAEISEETSIQSTETEVTEASEIEEVGTEETEKTETEETVEATEENGVEGTVEAIEEAGTEETKKTETEEAVKTTEVVELIESAETEELEEETEILSAGYAVSGNNIVISAANGEDIADTLDKALKEARDLATDEAPVTVTVPAGEYILSDNLHIYSNTILDLTAGVTLKNKGSHNMLMAGTNGSYAGYSSYNQSEACKGYNGFKNITIKGGTWISTSDNVATIIRIAHATNVTIEGITLTGGGCAHQMEVAAIDGFYVRNCTFKDFGVSKVDDPDKQEALQLDIPCSSDVFKETYEDGTVMKNVEITGCTFENVPRGVGTHTMLNGAYHENIKINGNTFKNIAEEAIVGLTYYNCEIKNNTIENCGAGILFQYFKADTKSVYTTIFDGKTVYTGTVGHDAKTVITGNTIRTKYSETCDEIQGIKVYGVDLKNSPKGADGKAVPANNYYISGVTVSDNTITTAGHGIHMVDAWDCTVTNNKITGKEFSAKDPNVGKYDGIFVATGSKNIPLETNKISGMSRNGIFVQESAYISTATGNKITENGASGINFYKNSGATGDISKNTISNCGGGGILVSTESTTGNILQNQMSGISGDAGIVIYKNSTVGEIRENTITGMGKDEEKKYCHGIKLTTGAVSGTIANNAVKAASDKYAAANGILIFNGSEVKGSIVGNTLEKTADMAISVSTKSSVSGDINANMISQTDKSGIFVYKSSKTGGDIAENTVTTAKESGIYISGDTTVKGSIRSNKITSVGGKGIYVYDSAKKTTVGKIENNTIKKAKSQGINVSSVKNNLTISGNDLSGGSDNVIIIQPNTTKYTITVENNTVKGNKKAHGIRVISGKISIANNKVSNVGYGIYTDKGVKGDVYNNSFGANVKTQVRINTASGKQDTKKINISSAKSSAKKKATIKWKKSAGYSGYEVQYATNKDFTKKFKKSDAKGKTTLTLTGLKSNTTYYVRVSGYKKVGDVKVHSNYGKVKTVKAK